MVRLAVAALAAAVFATGVYWGTFAVGGSDSACYVYQADLWASGRQRVVDPLAAKAPWPDAARTLAPVGHQSSHAVPGAIAPVCPSGLSLAMALFVTLGGRSAAFLVVPFLGGVLVIATFAIGRRFDPRVGIAAAILTACSPIVLFQLVQPMSDVPAAALWTLAVALAIGDRRWHAALAGLAVSAAVLVRPNLVPMGLVLGLFLLLRPGRSWATRIGDAATYAAACAPGCVAVLAVQQFFYGTPFESGYGSLSDIFSLANVRANAGRFPRWLFDSHTPTVLLACVAPLVTSRKPIAWLLAGMVAANVACYLPYIPFPEWEYLRFLLPSIPLLLVLTVAVLDRSVSPIRFPTIGPLRPGTVVLAVIVAALAVTFLGQARDHMAFQMKRLESRFVRGGTYAATRLPANAFVLTVWESGAVRYYAGRGILLWDLVDPAWLDRALAWLTAQGYEPFLMFESWEEQPFRERFAAASAIGRLDWPPIAEVAHQVRFYRPSDRERYFAGGNVMTDYAR